MTPDTDPAMNYSSMSAFHQEHGWSFIIEPWQRVSRPEDCYVTKGVVMWDDDTQPNGYAQCWKPVVVKAWHEDAEEEKKLRQQELHDWATHVLEAGECVHD